MQIVTAAPRYIAIAALIGALGVGIAWQPDKVTPGSIVTVQDIPGGTFKVIGWNGRTACWTLCPTSLADRPGRVDPSVILVEPHCIADVIGWREVKR